jgi:transcriptional regulator with XRE-family HTH domain
MVRRTLTPVPNHTLFNLRERAGMSQQDVAEAINRLAVRRGKHGTATANLVSRWERGTSRTSPFYRQLLAEVFGVTVEQLGLTQLRQTDSPTVAAPVMPLDQVQVLAPPVGANVTASQEQWRQTRQALNARRVPLAQTVADLYGGAHMPGTGLLINPGWLPDTPVRLADISLTHDIAPPPAVVGTDACTSAARPFAEEGRRFHRYSQAIRAIDHPRLFENRYAWRVLDVNWADGKGHMTFGDMSYFDLVDLGEAIAHEAADQLIQPGGRVGSASWEGLTARQAIGDPFNAARRAISGSTDTLTIRRDLDGSTFVLHQRNSGNVAVAGGMLHLMPCGIFQPSSVHPGSLKADFDLWRNIQREYSEEFLGDPEHDGSGGPVDYTVAPFDRMQQAVDDGRIRAYCLGVGLDALTLAGEIMTVVVFDADVYDTLFAEMVDINEEGTIVKTGRAHPTSAIPFTGHMVDELVDGGRLAPAAAGCLRLAWQHRRAILDG